MRILASLILTFVLFASVGPPLVHAQIIYQPPVMGQLVPVTGPNCPSIPITGGPALQTAPAVHLYGVCTYSGGRANVTVPAGLVLRWRYFVPSWWWPFQQEVTQMAYSGQMVATDWFELYYLPYAYVPGVPVYPPPSQPPTWPWPGMPQPSLPAPGTPAPPRTPTGVGNFSLAFAQGWSVAGWRLQYSSGRTVWTCHTLSAPEPGWVTDGVISPSAGDLALAPNPCP